MSLFKRYSEKKIFELIRNRDEQILPFVYKEYYTMVRNFILKNNGQNDEVEDVMQETVIAVWKNVSKNNFRLTSKLSTYVFSIAKNIWFKRLRKKSILKRVSYQEIETADNRSATYNSKIDYILDLVGELDETCRQLLTYFYFDGLNNLQIAEKMSLKNTNTVKSKKYQCMKKLEEMVVSKYNWEDFFG